MKPHDIKVALSSGDPTALLVRNGGWHGAPKQLLKMKPAFDDADDTWAVEIFSMDGVAVHEMWVDAENILAVCVPIVPRSV